MSDPTPPTPSAPTGTAPSGPPAAPPVARGLSLQQRFWKLTGLNILANLTVPLTGLVDTGMLGNLPDIRFLAGVALAGVIFDTLYWSMGFLRMGATGTTAQAVGALVGVDGAGLDGTGSDEEAPAREARRGEVYLVLYRSLVLALGIGAVLLALQVPLRELGFLLLAGEPGVEAAGRDYFAARIWGAPAVLANFAFLGWFLGREESGRALALTAVANLTNIALNYLFILRLGWAAQGAGLATAASQYTMLALSLVFFLRSGRPWRFRLSEIADRTGLSSLLKLNGDILVRSVLLSLCLAAFTNLSSMLGTGVLAANTILLRLFLVATYLIDGPAYATESLAGIFAGSRDGRSFRRLLRLAMAAGVGLAAVFLVGFFLFEGPIYRLLTSHESVRALAGRYSLWLVPVLLAGAAAFIFDGVFIGLTAGRALRDSMLLAALTVFAPIAAAAWYMGSSHLLWLAMAAFMVARTVALPWMGRNRFPPLESGPAAAPPVAKGA